MCVECFGLVTDPIRGPASNHRLRGIGYVSGNV